MKEKMHHFQRFHLERLCQKHNLDPHLIDDELTYQENKKNLLSLIPKEVEDLIKNGESQEEWYRKERFLSYYLSVRERKS